MTIQDLQCFITVAETLSYTQTAQMLYISQPAVTKHISSLERELQVLLINRVNRRQISLTEPGKILFENLKSAKQLYEDALRQLKAYSAEAPVISNLLKGVVLPFEYLQKYNAFAVEIAPTKMEIYYYDHTDILRCLENGELVMCMEEQLPMLKKYQSMLLSKSPVPYCILASTSHPVVQSHKKPVPEDFIGSPVLLKENTPDTIKNKLLDYLAGLYGHMPEEILYVDSLESINMYLHADRCITIASRWMGMCSDSNKYYVDIPLSTRFYLVWSSDMILPAHIEKLQKNLK